MAAALRFLAGVRALAGLTMREAWRTRLWSVFAIAIAGLAVAAPHLAAVDRTARLKLAVVTVAGVAGFATVLLAVLLPATQIRRDLESRLGLVLFPKPLGRGAYIAGRWLGTVGWLGAGMLALCLAGTGVVAWQFGTTPVMRSVLKPAQWEEVTALGEVLPIKEDTDRQQLSGPPGNGVRWSFRGLDPRQAPAEGFELLVRSRVQGYSEEIVEECRAEIVALPGPGQRWTPQALALDPASPYGRGAYEPGLDRNLARGVWLRNRDKARRDLDQDWLRLRLPAACVRDDGSVVVQLTRLDTRAVLGLPKGESCAIATPGGPFLLNQCRAGLILLAQGALLAAATLAAAVMANLGVALLAGLTVLFAGEAVWTVRDTLEYEKVSLPVRRLLEGAQLAMPDFERHQAAAQLAAGTAVPWTSVADAWAYFGTYALLCLVVAWWALARKEL